MKFSVKDLVTFTEEILNIKIYFIFCAVSLIKNKKKKKKKKKIELTFFIDVS